MHLIIYGSEGSGKGTQAKKLAQKYGLPVYTSGDLVRDAAKTDTGLIGDACRKALSSGTYVGDSEMFVLWKNKLKEKEAIHGFVLDGFPRTLRQSKFLLRKTKKYGYPLTAFVYLRLTDEEATKRLLARHRVMFEGSGESHDTPERIAQRLSTFRGLEKDVVSFFEKHGLVRPVDASKSVDDVFDQIVAALEKKEDA